MGPALYMTAAVLFSMLTGWLAVRLMNRSAAARGGGWPSPVTTVLSLTCWTVLSVIACGLAFTTTNAFRTSLVVGNMERNSPFSAIARHDQDERARLRMAVSHGLDESGDAGMQAAVMASVSRELGPYLTERLRKAPDEVHLSLAPILADALGRATVVGPCVLPWDSASGGALRGADGHALMEWTDRMISTAPTSGPPLPADEVSAARRDIAERAIAAGADPDGIRAALVPDLRDRRRCAAVARMIEVVIRDEDRTRAARNMRIITAGMSMPG